jgi:hypothetical protein
MAYTVEKHNWGEAFVVDGATDHRGIGVQALHDGGLCLEVWGDGYDHHPSQVEMYVSREEAEHLRRALEAALNRFGEVE